MIPSSSVSFRDLNTSLLYNRDQISQPWFQPAPGFGSEFVGTGSTRHKDSIVESDGI